MLTYPLATPPHSPADIRLFFKKSQGTSARRALVELGVNSSKENIRMAEAICSLAAEEFMKRWDFDPILGRPMDSERYQWTALKSRKSPKKRDSPWGLTYLGYLNDDCSIAHHNPSPSSTSPEDAGRDSDLVCTGVSQVGSDFDQTGRDSTPFRSRNHQNVRDLDKEGYLNQLCTRNLENGRDTDETARESAQLCPRKLPKEQNFDVKSPVSGYCRENLRWLDTYGKSPYHGSHPKTPSRKIRSLDSHTPRTRQCKITDFGRQRKRLHSLSKTEEGEGEREVCGPRKRLVLSPIKT